MSNNVKELKRLKKYHDAMEGYTTTIGLVLDIVSSKTDDLAKTNALLHKNFLEAARFIGKVCRNYSESGINVVKHAVENGRGYDTTKDFITIEKKAARDYAYGLYELMIVSVKAKCSNDGYQIDESLMKDILTGEASEADYVYLKEPESKRTIIKYSEEARGYALEAVESM